MAGQNSKDEAGRPWNLHQSSGYEPPATLAREPCDMLGAGPCGGGITTWGIGGTLVALAAA